MKYWLLAIGLAVVAVASRLLPHQPNFTAMGAVSLFAGTYLPGRWGILLPIGILFVTDTMIGFYEPLVMLGVYGSFALVGAIGWYIRRHKTLSTIFLGALSASIIFFAISNFAVWAATPWYPKTGEGLFTAYALAVPFFRNMLLGDIIYTGILFGIYEFGTFVLKQHQFNNQAQHPKVLRTPQN